MLLKKVVKSSPISFFILFLGFSIAAAIFFSFPYQRRIQTFVVVGTGIYYFLWGIWHHHKRGELCLKIAIEYLLFALLGTSILLSTILRG